MSIGYLALPIAKKTNVVRSGNANPVLVGGKQGEVWYDEERSSKEVVKFPVYSAPELTAERLADIDISRAMFELVTESSPGAFSMSEEERQVYEEGKHRVDVFEKSDGWVRVHFRNQPPWNGRSGWVKIDSNTGGYVQRAK